MTSRRDFLVALGATAVTPALLRPIAPGALATASSGPVAPARTSGFSGIGLQLYMVRQLMAADPEGTIARIAKGGFSEIEWWGRWPRTPAQLRAMLDANGLRSPSAHVDLTDLAPDRLSATLQHAATIGHSAILIAWTPPAQRKTADDWKRMAALLSTAGATAAKSGMRTGYHNHDFEFALFGDRTGFDILVAESDPAVVDIEIDCFWAYKAGHDPLTLLRRHRDRVTMLHLKDSSGAPAHEQRDVGAGVIDWRALLVAAASQRVTSVFVEHDDPADAFASAESSRSYLRTLGY